MTATAARPKPVYASPDLLLSAEGLSPIEGRRVTAVSTAPFTPPQSATGNRFLSIETHGSGGSRRYLSKEVSLRWDWLGRNTHDELCREVQLWRHGVLDRLPREMRHAIVACAQTDDGWLILMHDHRDAFLPLSRYDERRFLTMLDAAAAVHARFLQDPSLEDPRLGLCTALDYLSCYPHDSAHSPMDWDLLAPCCAAESIQILRGLYADPTPLCHGLERFPCTLVHGDAKWHNLAVLAREGGPVVAVDWQFAMYQPPGLELARMLHQTAIHLDAPFTYFIRRYRAMLDRRVPSWISEHDWDTQLQLALLAMPVFFAGRTLLWLARNGRMTEMRWWERQIIAGAELL